MDDTTEMKTAFKKMIDDIYDYYQKPRMNATSQKIYFGSLRDYSFSQVRQAIDIFLRDSSTVGWPPKADNLIKILDSPSSGIELTLEESRAWAYVAAPNISHHDRRELEINSNKNIN